MDLELLDVLVDIQKSIKNLESMLSEKSIKSSIQIDDDLIERFFRELSLFSIGFDESCQTYDVEDLKNKASFYFNSKEKINSPRAYLSKVMQTIKPGRCRVPLDREDTGPAPVKYDEFDHTLTDGFDQITDIEINALRYQYRGLAMVLGSRFRTMFSDMQKACVVHYYKKSLSENRQASDGVPGSNLEKISLEGL